MAIASLLSVTVSIDTDLRFETNFAQPIANVMTKDNLVTAPEGTSLSEAQKILGKHRIENFFNRLYNSERVSVSAVQHDNVNL